MADMTPAEIEALAEAIDPEAAAAGVAALVAALRAQTATIAELTRERDAASEERKPVQLYGSGEQAVAEALPKEGGCSARGFASGDKEASITPEDFRRARAALAATGAASEGERT